MHTNDWREVRCYCGNNEGRTDRPNPATHSVPPHSSPGVSRTSLVAEQRNVPLRQVAAPSRHQTAGPVYVHTLSKIWANTNTHRQTDIQFNAENADTFKGTSVWRDRGALVSL